MHFIVPGPLSLTYPLAHSKGITVLFGNLFSRRAASLRTMFSTNTGTEQYPGKEKKPTANSKREIGNRLERNESKQATWNIKDGHTLRNHSALGMSDH